MSSWGSYPSIYNMGHKAIQELLNGPVNVEEKIDGSQFSFGLVEASPVDVVYREDPVLGPLALKLRSKGAVMHIDAPEKMFALGGATVRELGPLLHPGWTYRGEFLAKPKHNSLTYDRTPKQNVILFDVSTGDQEYLGYDEKMAEANRLGLEVVPLLFQGYIDNIEEFRKFLQTTSCLGGQLIEGVVIKPANYDQFGVDKKVLLGKLVSEQFREAHSKSWRIDNPTTKDIIGKIGDTYTTTARWQKAIIHLRERGLINDDVSDIGLIIREVPEDIKKEHEDEIKSVLFSHFWPQIRRLTTRGLPDWYKQSILLPKAFDNP